MKLKIATSKLFVAIVACTFSVVSTTDHSNYDDTSHFDRRTSISKKPLEDRIRRSILEAPKLNFRRWADVPETTNISRQFERADVTEAANENIKTDDNHIVNNVPRNQAAIDVYGNFSVHKAIALDCLISYLRTADRFADNTVIVLGHILDSPNGNLTYEQYSSIEIIYNAIKTRQVHMLRLLPVFSSIQNNPPELQFGAVMVALSKKLPPYLAGAARFLVGQINLNAFHARTVSTNSTEDLNFFNYINSNEINISNLTIKEAKRNVYDEASRITEATLGHFFVNIFTSLSDRNMYISQTLFGCILKNLPNPDNDPIFNEYVIFIAELAFENKIPNWGTKKITPRRNKDVYALIESMTQIISIDPDVPYDIKQALWYIDDHFARPAKHNVSLFTDEAYLISGNDVNIRALLSLITPEEFSSRIIRLKDELIEYIVSHPVVMNEIFAGINRYVYLSPKQLLLASLTRIRTRLPAKEIKIRKSVSSLLSILLLKRQIWDISRTGRGGVTLWTLLETMNDSQTDPEIADLVQFILNELLQKVSIWPYIRCSRITSKRVCYSAKMCLAAMLGQLTVYLPENSLTLTTYEKIERLIDMINDGVNGNGESPTNGIPIDDLRMAGQSILTTRTGASLKEQTPGSADWNETSIERFTKYINNQSAPVLPQFVRPGMSIHVKVSESGAASIVPADTIASPDVVILPPFHCLQQKPRTENPETRCEKDMARITQPLSDAYGAYYIELLLGANWKVRHPTRIALLIDLLAEGDGNGNVTVKIKLFDTMKNYRIACKFVASYVLLPMVVDSQNLNTLTVWSTYDSNNLWLSKIESDRSDSIDRGYAVVTLPLVNPKIWLLPVDNRNPFANLLPYLPHDNPYSITIRPLVSLFEGIEIYELLGSSWKSSQYTDRGSLFISVLRTLTGQKVNKLNSELVELMENHLAAFEIHAVYAHVPHTYIKKMFHRYNVSRVEGIHVEDFVTSNDILLPPLIYPKKTIQVIIPKTGSPIIESIMSERRRSNIATILPSVNCLQGASNAEHDEDVDDTCDSVLECRLTEPLIEVFGDDYVQEILSKDWNSFHHTRMSYLANLLSNAVKNDKVISNRKLFTKVKAFKEALEVAAPYIFLPMIAEYQKLGTEVVWLTYNYENPRRSHMGRYPPQREDAETVTWPLANPKNWIQRVNKDEPFSGFLPNLPSTNSYAKKIAPLRSLLDINYLSNLTGSIWDPSQYPNKGAFFVSAMHTLLKLGSTRLNSRLNNLVRSYYRTIEGLALYIHVPRSYINRAVKEVPGFWKVDLVGLTVGLAEPKTDEERKVRSVLKAWLDDADLLKRLGISLPSLRTSKGELLTTIINRVLSSTDIHLEADTRSALRTFERGNFTTGADAEVIGWIWVRRNIEKKDIPILIIEDKLKNISTESMPLSIRHRYNRLTKYFADNRQILVSNDFDFQRYRTSGAFIRGYLNYLLDKSQISEQARNDIESVIPYIRYTGPGAISMW